MESVLPAELNTQFWSRNIPLTGEFNFKDFCCSAYCPCLVGQLCSEARKKDWKKLFMSFGFWILIVEIALYIATVAMSHDVSWLLEPNVDVTIDFGANDRHKIQCSHQYYRLLSYILLHGSWLHILFNGLSQFLFVIPCEAAWGIWKFLAIFLVSGITGGLLSDVRTSSCSVGASCSILGIQGAYLTLVFIYWNRLIPEVKKNLITMVIMIPVVFIAVSFLPRVDWLGHLGGLIGGMATACIVFANLGENDKWKIWLVISGVGVLMVLFIATLCVINMTGITCP